MQHPALHAVATSGHLLLATDFDGTLVPTATRPELARPSPELKQLLRELADLPGVTVLISSGRPRGDLEALLADAPAVTLSAEHGAWVRRDGQWSSCLHHDPDLLRGIADGLERLAAASPGALVERKSWGVAFHHRQVRAEDKRSLIVSAAALIDQALAAHPELERVAGKELIEVRLRAVHKGTALARARFACPGARVLALGDDVSDEDMFRALGPGDLGVLVSDDPGQPTAANLRVAGVEEVHALLAWVRDLRRGDAPAEPSCLVHESRPAPAASFDLLVVSNRLPELRAPVSTEEAPRKKNVGGLVSALTPVLAARRGLWLGWSGRLVAEEGGAEQSQSVDTASTPPLSWVDFPRSWHERYYNGLCNAALWPLLHSFVGRVRYDERDLAAYREANAAFARAAERVAGPDATVWVHDYHLLLLGEELRRRGHGGPIGLFLHVPFCGPDIFFVLPCAEELLRALLCLDLVGFHTAGYADNFLRCAAQLEGARVEGDRVHFRGRVTRAGVFPIGIIPEQFQPRSETPTAEIEALLRALEGRKLVLGVDRLDYTKGIPERLTAFGRLLEAVPEWRGKVCLVQVSVPSRADVPEYAEQRARVEQIVGRVNGDFGEADWVPIRYLYRSYGIDVLAQLYRAADVGYVTPLRDGMNLVAKEYVAAQDPERPGVLLLSRFAGAAAELKDALLTNPYDAQGMARDLDRALRLDPDERRARHARLRAAVERTTAISWGEEFLSALERAGPTP